MKVNVNFTLDVDNDEFWERFQPGEPDDSRRRDVIIRDDVRGLAAAAVVMFFRTLDEGGVLKGYDVPEWREDRHEDPQ